MPRHPSTNRGSKWATNVTFAGFVLLLASIPPAMLGLLLPGSQAEANVWTGVVDSARWVTHHSRYRQAETEAVLYLRLDGRDRQVPFPMNSGVSPADLPAGTHVRLWGYFGSTSQEILPSRLEREGKVLLAAPPTSPTVLAARTWSFRLARGLALFGLATFVAGLLAHLWRPRGLTTA